MMNGAVLMLFADVSMFRGNGNTNGSVCLSVCRQSWICHMSYVWYNSRSLMHDTASQVIRYGFFTVWWVLWENIPVWGSKQGYPKFGFWKFVCKNEPSLTINIPILPIGILDFCKQKLWPPPIMAHTHIVIISYPRICSSSHFQTDGSIYSHVQTCLVVLSTWWFYHGYNLTHV